jgi:hypothetical protein
MRDLHLASLSLSLGPNKDGASSRSRPLLQNIRRYITYFNYSGGSLELANEGDALIWESLWPPTHISNNSSEREREREREEVIMVLTNGTTWRWSCGDAYTTTLNRGG